MEQLFKLKQNGTTVRTEIVAGLTTFMTMAYIIALNPNLIVGFGQGAFGGFGADGAAAWNGVFLATCLASAFAMFCMAFLANKPFCLAPGMGLNSFFAVVIAQIAGAAGCTYLAGLQAGLCIILIEGIVFIVLSIFNIREKIVDAIPLGVRLGIAPAIGLMLMNIGFGSNAGVGAASEHYVMRDFFGALTPSTAQTSMGEFYPKMVLYVVTMFIGLFDIILLAKKGIKGAVLIGMLAASVIYWIGSFAFLKENPFASLSGASWLPPFGDMAKTTLFKFDFATLFKLGWFTVVTLVITFCMIDMFDTIGTLVGTASRAGMVDKDGNMPNMKEALLSDAIGSTGLTALTTGILFLACIFIAPIAAIIPAPATSAALIYVGVLMLQGLKNVKFDDLDQMVPVALMLIAMPISSSIGHAIGLGLISYTVIKVFSGKAKDVSILTYVISALFLIKFFLIV